MARVVLIQRIWQECLAMQTLSAVLKHNGHSVNVLIEQRRDDLLRKLEKLRPSLAAFSVITGDHVWAADTAASIKRAMPSVPMIAGGHHPTYFPHYIDNPGIDYICRGEGELALLELVQAIDSGTDPGRIANLSAKRDGHVIHNEMRPLIDPLDSLPFPDRSLYYHYPFFRRERVFRIKLSRGCPNGCTYCYNAVNRRLCQGKGKYIRSHSVDYSIAELAEIKERNAPRLFYIEDDVFGQEDAWAAEFLDRYAEEIRVPFICNTHVRWINEDFVRRLKRARCRSAQFGLETGNDELRQGLLNRKVKKEDLIRAAECLHREGIPFQTSNMVGLPGETVDQAFETVDINARIKTDYPMVCVFQPWPQTPLYDYAVEHGYAEPADIDRIPSSILRDSIIRQPNISQLVNLHRLFIPAARFPRLRPLFKLLVKLPPNPVFDWIYFITFGLHYAKRTNRNVIKTAWLGLRNLRYWRS